MSSPEIFREKPPEIYLGDGLYASFDGWQINLRAPREDGDHEVSIEPAVWDALLEWAKDFWLE